MQEIKFEHVRILRKMVIHQRIGAAHILVDNLVRVVPKDRRGAANDAIEDLIRWGILAAKSTKHGKAISIVPESLDRVREILGVSP